MNEEKKLFIETYGCQMNAADSEVVAAVMKNCRLRSCRYGRRGGCCFSEHLFDSRQCGAENIFPSRIFCFFAEKARRPQADSRRARLHGRTGQKMR